MKNPIFRYCTLFFYALSLHSESSIEDVSVTKSFA